MWWWLEEEAESEKTFYDKKFPLIVFFNLTLN